MKQIGIYEFEGNEREGIDLENTIQEVAKTYPEDLLRRFVAGSLAKGLSEAEVSEHLRTFTGIRYNGLGDPVGFWVI